LKESERHDGQREPSDRWSFETSMDADSVKLKTERRRLSSLGGDLGGVSIEGIGGNNPGRPEIRINGTSTVYR
jgi:hypothetical protein